MKNSHVTPTHRTHDDGRGPPPWPHIGGTLSTHLTHAQSRPPCPILASRINSGSALPSVPGSSAAGPRGFRPGQEYGLSLFGQTQSAPGRPTEKDCVTDYIRRCRTCGTGPGPDKTPPANPCCWYSYSTIYIQVRTRRLYTAVVVWKCTHMEPAPQGLQPRVRAAPVPIWALSRTHGVSGSFSFFCVWPA